MPKSQTLTEVFDRKKGRYCSIEVSPKKPLPFEILDKIKLNYISIIWMGTHQVKPEEIDGIILAKDLISKGYSVLLHVTARNHDKKSLMKVLEYAKTIGVKNLFCIRGGSQECKLPESNYDFPFTTDMLSFVRNNFSDYFDMCVAAFPYKHPDSKSLEADMKFLKEKCDAGANFIITQACFSYDVYKTFLMNCRKFNINVPVIPGVFIIQSTVDFCLLKKLCKVPQDDPAIEFVQKNKGKEAEIAEYGMKLSKEIVQKLLQDTDFMPPHIYSMNEFNALQVFLKEIYASK